jgi:hypothetical protein
MSFERSADTDSVIIALRGCNNEVSYRDLANQAGLTLQRTKQVLASARRVLRADNGVLFGVIRGVGLRRLTDVDKVKKPEAFKKRVFRGAGREIKDLGTISDFGGLSKADQHSVSTNRTVLNVLRHQSNVKPEPPKATTAKQPMPDIAKLISMNKKPP